LIRRFDRDLDGGGDGDEGARVEKALVRLRIDPTAIRLRDGRVLVAGRARVARWAELYDPSTGEFVSSSPLDEDRTDYTATLLLDGNVLIAGGTANAGGVQSENLASAELYHP
jgi:hypothetical protein